VWVVVASLVCNRVRSEASLKIKDHLGQLALFGADWGFQGAVYGTPTVLKRDPRRNFIENIAFLGLSVGPL
jgi:hypothetical protein